MYGGIRMETTIMQTGRLLFFILCLIGIFAPLKLAKAGFEPRLSGGYYNQKFDVEIKENQEGSDAEKVKIEDEGYQVDLKLIHDSGFTLGGSMRKGEHKPESLQSEETLDSTHWTALMGGSGTTSKKGRGFSFGFYLEGGHSELEKFSDYYTLGARGDLQGFLRHGPLVFGLGGGLHGKFLFSDENGPLATVLLATDPDNPDDRVTAEEAFAESFAGFVWGWHSTISIGYSLEP